MATAIWNDTIIAQSDVFETVEGNIYFPPESLRKDVLSKSTTTSRCPWKGEAHYYNITVNGKTLEDAAWYYPDPKDAASEIKDHVAFWKGVKIKR